jgi:DegV family protein with EDD domain
MTHRTFGAVTGDATPASAIVKWAPVYAPPGTDGEASQRSGLNDALRATFWPDQRGKGEIMRIGVAIDAACDLPQDFIEKHRITVLPITIRVDGETFLDERDPVEIQRFIDQGMGSRAHSAETEPSSVEHVQKVFLDRMIVDYDCVLCLTITATRSPIHDNVIRASFAILKHYRPLREAAGIHGPFLMRVVDTRNLFAGSAACVVEAVRMIDAGESPQQMRERVAHIANHSYGYMLPRDLYYMRARAKKKGDRSVGMFSPMLGTALDIKPLLRAYRGETGPVGKIRGFEHGAQVLFDYAAKRVQAGLLVPTMSMSYGGHLDVMRNLPGYDSLVKVCEEAGVAVLESPMSITGMVNVGEGAITLGFAAEEHVADF